MESDNHVGVGLVGAQWLMRTLSDNGRADLAFTITTQKTYPGWGYMVEKGATTVWELWNGDTADPAMNSGNHVMQIGDLGLWMYEYLAGIRTDPRTAGIQARHRETVSGRQTRLGEGDAQDGLWDHRQFVEEGRREAAADRDHSSEHDGQHLGSGQDRA